MSEDAMKGFVEFPSTLNKYDYCWNNPLNLVDLDGLYPIDPIFKLIQNPQSFVDGIVYGWDGAVKVSKWVIGYGPVVVDWGTTQANNVGNWWNNTALPGVQNGWNSTVNTVSGWGQNISNGSNNLINWGNANPEQAAAGAGAVLGGGFELSGQVTNNLRNECPPFHDIDWLDVGLSAAEGGIHGYNGVTGDSRRQVYSRNVGTSILLKGSKFWLTGEYEDINDLGSSLTFTMLNGGLWTQPGLEGILLSEIRDGVIWGTAEFFSDQWRFEGGKTCEEID